jgi:hypothetical protein
MTNRVFYTIEKVELPLPNPLEKHTANSKWQYCNCETCQRKRMFLDSLPGQKIDYNTFRHKGENY